MSDETTVNITDVEPKAVRVKGSDLKSGDRVFDVWGHSYKIRLVTPRKDGRISFRRSDFQQDWIGADETITIIPGEGE